MGLAVSEYVGRSSPIVSISGRVGGSVIMSPTSRIVMPCGASTVGVSVVGVTVSASRVSTSGRVLVVCETGVSPSSISSVSGVGVLTLIGLAVAVSTSRTKGFGSVGSGYCLRSVGVSGSGIVIAPSGSGIEITAFVPIVGRRGAFINSSMLPSLSFIRVSLILGKTWPIVLL